MNEALIQRLDERTARVIEIMDKHIEDDKAKFLAVFKKQNEHDIYIARSSIILGAIVVIAQIVIGAWVKGLF